MSLMTTMMTMILAAAPAESVPVPKLTFSPSANYGAGHVVVQAGRELTISVEASTRGKVTLWAVQMTEEGPKLETLTAIGQERLDDPGEASWKFKLSSEWSGQVFQVIGVVRDERGLEMYTELTTVHLVPWPPLIIAPHPIAVK